MQATSLYFAPLNLVLDANEIDQDSGGIDFSVFLVKKALVILCNLSHCLMSQLSHYAKITRCGYSVE